MTLLRTLATKELAVTSRQHTTQRFLFHQGIFDKKNNMTVVLHPPYFSLFPRLKKKCLHFDPTEVMEAESQAVLNTLTVHDFQDEFKKNGRNAGNGA
jgi:hypothetical protein